MRYYVNGIIENSSRLDFEWFREYKAPNIVPDTE